MNNPDVDITSSKKKHPVRKTILRVLVVLLIILSAGAVYLYINFNKLLSDALRKNFNNSLISDVYELKFEKLSVNFLMGNISVHNVDLQPREKPLNSYPYINSSFHLKAGKILLGNVEIKKLLKENILRLDKIELDAPGIDFTIADINPIFFPFNDTTLVETKKEKNKKRSIESYFLKEFQLTDATFHVSNSAKHREFNIQDININLLGLLLDQQPGKDVFSYQKIDLSIGKSTGEMKKMALKHISFKDYSLTIDSLQIQRSKDTMIFHFADFRTGINELDIQTKDSIFHLYVKSFDLSYRDKSLKTQGVIFKPNISDAAMQARYHFQHARFSGTLGDLQMTGVNFDSLIYARKLLVDQIMLDKVSASIFKDKTKPFDTKRFPVYPGQSIRAIAMPMLIKQVKATNVSLVSKERKPDGSFGIANINRGTAEIKHITNLSSGEMLMLKADAYLENKAHFNLSLQFSYLEPQFSFDARIDKFNLPDLNTLLQSFTPAKINKGTLDELTFSGKAYRSNATGTMKFLYHDLDIDLAIKDQAKWKSTALAFAANTILPEANPVSANMPEKIVQFSVERDMNKGFINIILKSLFAGLKETMVLTKENRKEYRAEKKEVKKQAKREKKKERKNKKT
jgi:hypothetical protein